MLKCDISNHLLSSSCSASDAIRKLEYLSSLSSQTLLVINDAEILVGTLTDGDVRRGLLKGLSIFDPVSLFMNKKFYFISDFHDIRLKVSEFKRMGVEFLPFLDKMLRIIKVLDLTSIETIVPVTALIMAGGEGQRLRPYTNNVPKPMLLVGEKPIIEHNIDRMIKYGISEIYVSVKYLGHKIMDYFGDGTSKGISINYIIEDEPRGTIGALSEISNNCSNTILVMNSDILTNIDYNDFYDFHLKEQASMTIASIPYEVQVPYAVLETNDKYIKSFAEKPSYTYYSNGGIYLIDKANKIHVPSKGLFNATDLMYKLINMRNSVLHYPLLNYWLDIGRPIDYQKAQEDIKHLIL